MSGAFNPADVGLILPEMVLGGAILLLFIGDLVVEEPRKKRWILTLLALGGLLACAATVAAAGGAMLSGAVPATSAFAGQLAVDPIGTLFKVIFIAIAVVGVLASLLSKELPDKHIGEYHALLLSITLGMFLMASANDLLMVYLGVELVSIVSYAMAGYRLHDKRSSEAALKYVIYGGAASGLMLFGISLFYGLFGTLELTAVNHALASWSAGEYGAALTSGARVFPLTVLASILFIFAGIAYKIAAVPFHMWSPDVYEGAPTPFTGFLSVGPKAAGFALLMRFFVGAVLSVTQTDVKRLLAYSSIAHAGYILMGFVVLSEAAVRSVVFYLVIYFFMNMGAFLVVQAVRDRTGGELIHDFRGLGSRSPLLAVAMVIFLLSLTGLPPLAGFVAKFYVFMAVIERGGTWYYVLAVIAAANSAVSLYYSMRIARAMFLTEPLTTEPLREGAGYAGLTAALVVPVLVLGLYWSPVYESIRSSTAFFRSRQPPRVAVQAAPAAPAEAR
jgi:NADH-quinone oxidoreductase subunit N